jgi:hypothetical protein
MSKSLDEFQAGLRCNDVHNGLKNVDPNSTTISRLEDTRMIGMAGSLASLIRGQDVVQDAQALKQIVAEQLDISPYAFEQVVQTLEKAGMVAGIQRSGNKIVSFTETVPYYQNLYEGLGTGWFDRAPNQFEQQMVTVVNELAKAPVPAEELAGLSDDHGPGRSVRPGERPV